ncbi:MAG: Holliday junction resolvase RuvX [Chloroflexi bacterium]|nr:Holliday junction resolvase RuvX [Chloroflexota bacterium]
MRILAIDHGDARIGLAVSDEGGMIARPLQILKHTAKKEDAEKIARIALENNVEKIVIGLPLDDEGKIGHQANKVKRWAEALKEATTIPIEFWDESFTSEQAETLKRKRGEAVDDKAAAFILQNYLDAKLPSSD